jgi:hypothetical protein
MNADITTIIVAILGVTGTLSAPMLAQQAASRAKRSEFNMQRVIKETELRENRRLEAFKERRTAYANLNSAARQYLEELRANLRMLAAGVTGEGRSDLAQARQRFRELYSDAQMIMPDRVLEYAIKVSQALGEAYGEVKRLDALSTQTSLASAAPEISFDRSRVIEQTHAFCRTTVYDQIIELRNVMRHDLGVSEPTDVPFQSALGSSSDVSERNNNDN